MGKYNFVFWGNINIHVYPLAEALSKKTKVTIVYDSRLFTNRKERQIGYKPSPTLRLIDMADISDDEIKNVIKDVSEGETIHINGGLKNDNNFAHKALIMLIKLKKQVISLPQEGFQFNGLKAFVNRLKWFYYINVRYRNIRFFGLTGRNAFHDFLTIKCSIKRIVPFIYTTTPPQLCTNTKHNERKNVNMIFVGAIDKRKNIGTIIRWINKNIAFFTNPFDLHIYGGYGNEALLRHTIGGNKQIHYHGIVPNEDVRKAMLESDIAILPSRYDGWGAVVNEALQCGCRVLVSNRCGSSAMPQTFSELGSVFDPYDEKDFLDKLNGLLSKGILSETEREKIRKWSEEHIHPDVVANYLINVIDALDSGNPLPKNIFW